MYSSIDDAYESSDYGWLPGHWLSALDPPGEGEMVYQDSFGVHVAGDFNPQAPAQPLPEYMGGCGDIGLLLFGLTVCQQSELTIMPMIGPGIILCAAACLVAGVYIGIALPPCKEKSPPEGCNGLIGPAYWACLVDCSLTNGCKGVVAGFSCTICALCIVCRIPGIPKTMCKKLMEKYIPGAK